MAATSGPGMVIAVGGFAGLFTARALGPAPVQVTLIGRAEHRLFARRGRDVTVACGHHCEQ
jgi:NADH dehydrogenase FAD-containing subunit